jgi:hypothetical protein
MCPSILIPGPPDGLPGESACGPVSYGDLSFGSGVFNPLAGLEFVPLLGVS